jgi:DNA-binding MarR family transcriptional regulator
LSDGYLARERPRGAARVRGGIGRSGRAGRALRARLGLDSGQLSRVLRSLEGDGLIRVEPGREDRRVRMAHLTAKGRAELDLLDRRSDELAQSMLAPLDATHRERLVSAMATVERLLTAAMVDIRETDPGHPDARRCVGAYFAELDRRSDSGFDPAAGISAARDELLPPRGAFLVAYLGGEPVGCGAVKHPGGRVADIKRMWVAEAARGRGIARRLLAELEARASKRGASVARLETNRALVEAIAMYRSSGYEEVPAFNDEPFADHWFEKRLT